METAKILVLSALIALSSSFTDGLKQFEQGKFDEAILSFTKVVESKEDNRFKDLALFYRAQCFHAKNDNEKAFADLLSMLEISETSPYTAEARRLYQEWGGPKDKLKPELSPKQVLIKFAQALDAKDIETAKKFATEAFIAFISKYMTRNEDDIQIMTFLAFAKINEEFVEGDHKTKAKITLNMPGMPEDIKDKMQIELILDKERNIWLLDKFSGKFFEEVFDMDFDHGDIRDNSSKLKTIGLALRMYSQENNEIFPPNFDALKEGGYLEEDEIYFWVDPESGNKALFMYRPGLTENDDVDSIVCAAPAAVKGKREVLFIDGHVQMIDDVEFRKMAAKQGWKFSGLIKKEEISPERQEEIRNIIKLLGNEKSSVRKEAKKKLQEMGVEAMPIMEEFINDPDPEIKMNVKELLGL